MHSPSAHVSRLMSSRPPVFSPPTGYPPIKVVGSFEELLATPFGDGINAFCWPRVLPGDFGEIVEKLEVTEGITALDAAMLGSLSLSNAGVVARGVMLADYQHLRDHGLSPVLDCIQAYPRDEDEEAISTDVYSFHADSAPVAAETWLCTYHGAASEGLRNDEAQRRIDIPETRDRLLQLFGGEDGEDFREWLAENCFDLHYAPLPHAQPFSFGLGNLWRLTVDYPGSPVPPCIHRAPENHPRDPARLLLIS
jgi:hypothetical protein